MRRVPIPGNDGRSPRGQAGAKDRLMKANLLVFVASALALTLFVSTVGHPQSDQALAPGAGGASPLPEASSSAPPTEKSALPSAADNPVPNPTIEAPAPKPEAQTAPMFRAEQLDQLLAPIALFPDALLAHILMAATYPLEIVKADRWLQDLSHANLRGDQLAGALEAETWDPSVKSLVPFPQILRMMDEQLDWTENLGNAVAAQQPDVMDAVQRLRYQAAAAGTLWSNEQQRVTTERQGIVIEPANPELVYPPIYSPAGVYGPWPYPDYPPFDISPFETDFGLAGPFGIGFGAGFVVVRPLWHWCFFDWAQRRIRLDADRFNALNRHMPGTATSIWHRDPSRLSLPSGAFASRGPIQVFRGSANSAAMIPRVNMQGATASLPTAMRGSAAPTFTPVGPAPTAVLRSAPRSFAFAGRGLQARIESRPGLFSHQMGPPSVLRQFVPATLARTVAHPIAPPPGGGVRSGGSHQR